MTTDTHQALMRLAQLLDTETYVNIKIDRRPRLTDDVRGPYRVNISGEELNGTSCGATLADAANRAIDAAVTSLQVAADALAEDARKRAIIAESVRQRLAGITAQPCENKLIKLAEELKTGPVARCSACGRAAWSTDYIGCTCNMSQPDGSQCAGSYRRT